MLYHADYCGMIVPKQGSLEIVLEILGKNELFEANEDLFGDIWVTSPVAGIFQNVYDEDAFAWIYHQIEQHILEASIEFEGEDSTFWKHEFKDGVWNEYMGEIVYNTNDRKTL